MDIQGYFTKKGLALAAKLAAGSTLKITRVCAGAAETALSASALSQIRQTLSVGAARRSGDAAVLPVTLEAGMSGGAYTLRELGVYAQDPEEDEVLYKIYRLSEPVEIRPSSRLVLRFYLEETVSQDLNVTVVRASAGLLTEADLEPVRNKVEAVGVPGRLVTVEAADLQAYIDALPRLRTESLNIQVNAGHVPKTLRLENFYGPGFLWIIGQGADSGSVLDDGIVISSCSNRIRIIGFDVRGRSVGTAAQVSTSPLAGLENLTADGNSFPNGANNGISSDGSAVFAANFTISHFTRAVYGASIFRLLNCGGSDNASGIAVEGGGVVLLSGSTPELMGGAVNKKWGGIIIDKTGTPV